MKEITLDSTLRKTRFGRAYETVASHARKKMNTPTTSLGCRVERNFIECSSRESFKEYMVSWCTIPLVTVRHNQAVCEWRANAEERLTNKLCFVSGRCRGRRNSWTPSRECNVVLPDGSTQMRIKFDML